MNKCDCGGKYQYRLCESNNPDAPTYWAEVCSMCEQERDRDECWTADDEYEFRRDA